MLDRKTLLFFAIIAVSFLLWSAWQQDYPKKPAPEIPVQPAPSISPIPGTGPKLVTPTESAVPSSRIIRVTTDVLDLQIDKKGGNIVSLRLPKYPKAYETPNIPVELLSSSLDKYYVAQTGLISNQGPDSEKDQALYTTDQTSYTLTNNQKQLIVDLKWQSPNSVIVVKRFVFDRSKYNFNVSYLVNNKSPQNWVGNFYAQIKRRGLTDGEGTFGLHTYRGAAISGPGNPYQKISYKQMDKQNLNATMRGGWIAMQQRYFVSTWIPQQLLDYQFYSYVERVGASDKSFDKVYTIGFLSPPITLLPNGNTSFNLTFYGGPEIAQVLASLAPNLDLVIDYGWLWIFSVPIFKVMQAIYFIVGNWGWAIVLVTVLIKLLFYKLSEVSYRSMAKMRDVQPQILALRERYGEDRQKLSAATMELYRKEKINPLGGCLPILVQIPVFIALYYVLVESVELRQAPFIGWIHDLSVRDPYYVLPILMGLSMLVQQRLNPPPADPTQAKMMMALPIVFMVLFATFPAGLVLYWLVNNCLSILQQWYIMRKHEKLKQKKTKK